MWQTRRGIGLAALALMGGVASAAYADEAIAIGGDDDIHPQPSKRLMRREAIQPIVETRQVPKEKSASLQRMLKKKTRI